MNVFNRNLIWALLALSLSGTLACSSNSSSDDDNPDKTTESSASSQINVSSSSSNSSASSSSPKPGATEIGLQQSTYQISENSPSFVITLVRTGDPNPPVTVNYTTVVGTADESDFIAANGTISWAAGETTDKQITLEIYGDALEEGNETYSVALSDPSVGATISPISNATITIEDDDLPDCIDLETTTITENTLLDHPCYQVNSSVSVTNAATLTISPGVTLIFAEGRNLTVESDGVLNAIGSELLPIVFTGAIKTPGYWQGLEVQSVATSKITYAFIEYAGGSGFNEASVGLSFDGRLEMDFTSIEFGASYGVSVNSQNAILASFTHNTISRNEAPPIYIQANLLFAIEASNQLTGNEDTFGEGYDFIQVAGNSGGEVIRNQTWQNVNVPIHLGGLRVEAELTIEPGMTFVFAEDAQLYVSDDGTLKAIGDEAEPIIFTAEQKTPGYWRGIQFTFNNNANELHYCIIEYGGADSNGNANVSVFGTNGRLIINNSDVRFSEQYGLSFSDGVDLTMEGSIIESNRHPLLIEVNDLGKLSKTNDFNNNTNNYIVVTGSTVRTAQAIPELGVPYRFSRTTTTSVDASLVIEAGVEIQFASGGGFNVDRAGSLSAVGTEEQPVLLTGVEKVKGYWNGIQYTFSGSEQNNLNYVIAEYGGAASGNTEGLVGYFGQNSGGTISNSKFRFSDTNGIWIDDTSDVDFANGNTFENIDELDVYIDN